MTPEEWAAKLVTSPVPTGGNTGLINIGDRIVYCADTETSLLVIRREIAAYITRAVAEAVVEERLAVIKVARQEVYRQAYSYGLPLTEDQETEVLAALYGACIAPAVNKPLTSSQEKHDLTRPMRAIEAQLDSYRGLLAAMAHDNGYQEGFEKGRKIGAEEAVIQMEEESDHRAARDDAWGYYDGENS